VDGDVGEGAADVYGYVHGFSPERWRDRIKW
jgi:hypothetical protein